MSQFHSDCEYSQLHMRNIQSLTHPSTPVKRERTGGRHDSKHTDNHTKKGWLFASGSSWTPGHTGGSRQDTHGTPVPPRRKAVGGPTAPRRNDRQTTHNRQGLETNVLRSDQVLRNVYSHNVDLDSDMVAEPVRETGDPLRVVELRDQTRRQKSRSGDVPDHQEAEDQHGKDQPRDRVHQVFYEEG